MREERLSTSFFDLGPIQRRLGRFGPERSKRDDEPGERGAGAADLKIALLFVSTSQNVCRYIS